MIEQILEFFKRHISITSQIPTGHLQRQETFAYPFPALREAILNAVKHRDYESYQNGISVIIKPRSLEIWNSGALPAGMTPDDLKREHHSRPQNPDIAHVFSLRGYVERIGSGAGRMIIWCHNAGLPDPEWRQDSGGVAVIFRKAGETTTLNDRQKRFLNETRGEAACATVEYRQQFSISAQQARNDLADLVKRGYLRRTGAGPTTRYVRTEKKVE